MFPTPTTKDVARYLRARTKDTFGKEVGDFTDETTPTGVDVIGLIADAADEVAEAVGSDPPADLANPIKRVVTMLAAANVEMSFFPEQAAQNNSMYDKLMMRVNALRSSLETDTIEEDIEIEENRDATYNFPNATSWGTVSW